jgi:hypothetical protein
MESDLIEEYLTQLRLSLLTSPRRAQLIRDEAEDHLRESAAAGQAAGLTEVEAQRAAIASFGSVQAVVRAHAATLHGRAAGALVAAALATWKLASIYLLAVFVTGLAWHLLGNPLNRLTGVTQIADGVPMCSRCGTHVAPLAGVSSLGTTSILWLGAGLVGLVLIGGFALVRRWQQRGGRVRPSLPGTYSSLAGVIASFALTALLILAWKRSGGAWEVRPNAGITLIASFGSAVCYLVALGLGLHRGQRSPAVRA